MDLGLILASGCALSLVCLGLIALLAFVVVRFTGRTIGEIIGGDADEENLGMGNIQSAPGGSRRSAGSSLRDRARNLDFDAAIQRQQGRTPMPPDLRRSAGGTDFNAQSSGDRRDVPPGFEEPPRGNLRSQRTRRREDNVEIYDDEGGDLFDLM